MGQKFPALEPTHIEFIEQQPLFYVATAPREGHINLSPKGYDSLRVLGPNRILWLNLTGSGNETAAHLLEDERMTLMFNSFGDSPLILRTYGTATAIYPDQLEWDELYAHFPDNDGYRQIFDLQIDLVHSSCGFGVPKMELVEPRPHLDRWIEKKGSEGIQQYQREERDQSGWQTHSLTHCTIPAIQLIPEIFQFEAENVSL